MPIAPHLADLTTETLGGWLIVLLLTPGLLVMVGLVLAYVLSRTKRTGPTVPTPGYYQVLGIDRQTGQRREATFHAETQQSARGRAELDGIIVTDIRMVDESLR
jgi:hypothetical protein